jgi:hypothetical protein
MTTFEALAHKTRTAATIAELNKVETQHSKHYHAGTISVSELIQLDRMAMNQYVKIVEDATKPLSHNP